MGFRLTAALVAVLIAIALVATFVAVHNHPVGEIPAGQSENVKAYRAMIQRDYNAMDASTSNHCNTIQDTGCAAAVEPVKIALQRWVDDMQAFANTPAQFTAIDAAIRAHLKDVITDSNAGIAFQKSGDEAGFNLAFQHSFYERAWIDPATSLIEGTYPPAAAGFADAIARAKHWVAGCLSNTPIPEQLECNRLSRYESCPDAQALLCDADVKRVETSIQTYLVAMAQNPAPSPQAAGYAKLQYDLQRADASILAIHDVLLTRDSVKLNLAETPFLNAIQDLNRDLNTI
jgi:hypothetical protein